MSEQPRETLKPRRLSRGDCVGVISPAGPVEPHELEAGVRILEASGFMVRLSAHVFDKKDYLAGEDPCRLEDLHDMFLDDEIKAVFCSRGGYGTLRLLDEIDFDRIKKHPKILVGYSDITALLMAVYENTGLVAFHGPMVRELAVKDAGNWDRLCALLTSTLPLRIGFTREMVLRPGKAQGILLGGNLAQICHLVGTPHMPSLEGAILFLEDKGEPLYRIDRMLTHLRLSGHLKGLAGLIGGDFEQCGERAAIDRLLAEAVRHSEIPVLSGLSVGHGERNIALPVGLGAEMDTDLLSLSLAEPCVTG